jgi:hypothetical protein
LASIDTLFPQLITLLHHKQNGEAEPERCPLLAKVRLIADTRQALAALLKRPSTAPPLDDAAAIMAAILRGVPSCLQPRAQWAAEQAAASCSASGERQDVLASCVHAVLQSLPRVEVGFAIRDCFPSSYESIYASPPCNSRKLHERLYSVLRAVAGRALQEEGLYRELEGFMYPRWVREDELPWYVRAQRQG